MDPTDEFECDEEMREMVKKRRRIFADLQDSDAQIAKRRADLRARRDSHLVTRSTHSDQGTLLVSASPSSHELNNCHRLHSQFYSVRLGCGPCSSKMRESLTAHTPDAVGQDLPSHGMLSKSVW
jgi:hypothetical protein